VKREDPLRKQAFVGGISATDSVKENWSGILRLFPPSISRNGFFAGAGEEASGIAFPSAIEGRGKVQNKRAGVDGVSCYKAKWLLSI
jgi:hypothetical protein